MKPEYTFEEILVLLERARMDDVSQRLRELWAEKEALAAPQVSEYPAPAQLSNEQIADIWVKTLKGTSGTFLPSVEFARAIERHVSGVK